MSNNNNNKFFDELFKIFKRGYSDTVKDQSQLEEMLTAIVICHKSQVQKDFDLKEYQEKYNFESPSKSE